MSIKRIYLKVFLSLILLVAGGYDANAQDTLNGQVIDLDTAEPVIGANVYVKGKETEGVATDLDGNFKISVVENDIIVISSIGYVTQAITYTGQATLSVKLAPDVKSLAEVVVIGYGTVEKKDATGAVTSISSDDFNKGNQGSTQDLIVGKLAGVQVTPSAEPGGEAQIRIRGGSSLVASNKPLFVVDGVVFSDEQVNGLGNPLNLINPNDIESITILKDASATAIYGSRASNGVILVTTKKGSVDDKLFVTYDGKFSLNTLPKKVNVFSGDEYRALLREQVDQGNISEEVFSKGYVDEGGKINTDWQDEVFQTGFSQDHNLSLVGAIGLLKMPMRVSLGYTDQRGVLMTSEYKRYSASLSSNKKFLTDHLSVNLNARYSRNDSRFADKGALNNAIVMDPTKPVRDENSTFGGYWYWRSDLAKPSSDPNTQSTRNPVAQLKLTDDGAIVDNFNGNVQLDYKFHFLPDLRVNLNMATVRSETTGDKIQSKDLESVFTGGSNATRGKKSTYTGENTNDLLEAYASYDKDGIVKGIDFDILGGYSWQRFYRKTDTEDRFIEPDRLDKMKIDESENYLVSFYGRLNLNVFKKYLFTFTLRQDGSSRFGEDNKWGLFPAAAIAWRIKDENFLKDNNVISDLKIRLGYGVTGQENVKNYYPALAKATISDVRARYYFGDKPVNTIRLEGYDANLKWESTTTYNLGLDYELFDGRLSGAIEVYNRITDDLLNTVPVAIGSNFTDELLTNVGSLENKGIEFSVQGLVLASGDHKLSLGANFTYNKNEITKLTLVDDPDYIGVPTGSIAGGTDNKVQIHAIGSPTNTFFLNQQLYDSDGNPIEGAFLDKNNDGEINEKDLVKSKTSAPDIYGGINGNYSYKKWTLNFNGRFSINNYVYDNITSQYGFYNELYVNGYAKNLVTRVNDTKFVNAQYLSDYHLYNASFFRMDNISLGYNFGDVYKQKMYARAIFTVQNAFVITKYHGLDPEIANGIENSVYPRARTYTLGVTLNFK